MLLFNIFLTLCENSAFKIYATKVACTSAIKFLTYENNW
jgi:hypothetical protein